MRTSYPKLHSIKFKSGAFADNVEHIGNDSAGVPVINILEGAAMSMLNEVVLIGYDADGREYIAGSTNNPNRAAYMFARGHLHMLRLSDD